MKQAVLAIGIVAMLAVVLFLFLGAPRSPASAGPEPKLASPVAPSRRADPPLIVSSHGGPAQQPPGSSATAQKPGGGDPALFGKLVALGQGLTLAEALQKNASEADTYVDKLCEETRKLREKPPLPDEPGAEHDAAAFMAPLMDYEPPLDKPPGRLHLRAELAERLKSYGPDWPMRITDSDLRGLDFRWLAELGQYDHWTLLGAGRLRDLPPGNLFTEAIPNYWHLMFWVKLRYALAFRRADLPAAVREARHLAMLVHTQRILLAESVANAMGRFESRAREVATASGADVTWWDAPAADQLDRQRRASFASIYFSYPGVSEATLRKAADCAPSACVMLIEGATANRTFGAYGATDNLELIGSLVERYGCEAAVLERIRQSRELPAPEALEALQDDLGEQIAKHLGAL